MEPAEIPKPVEVTVLYRIEPQRVFEITNEHADRKARARMMAVLRSSMFAKKRYQDFYINCSLNNLYNALRIASFFHTRVPELSMTIRFIGFQIVEVKSDGTHNTIDRKRIEIKLTKVPTEEDQAEAGFNPGLLKEHIENPIQDILHNQGRRDNRPSQNQRPRRVREEKKREENKREPRKQPPAPVANAPKPKPAENKAPKPKYRVADDELPEDEEEERREQSSNVRGRRMQRGGGNAGRGGERVQMQHEYKSSHIKQ